MDIPFSFIIYSITQVKGESTIHFAEKRKERKIHCL